MNDNATNRFETFLRVNEFAELNDKMIPADSMAAAQFAIVKGVTTELEQYVTDQDTSRRGIRESGASKAAARDELQRDMAAINRTARAMAETMPGILEKFRIPYSANDQGWLAAARSFAQNALPLKDEFIRRGMAADFIADLIADTEDFEGTIAARTQQQEKRVAATAAIDDAIERGMRALRQLDAIIRNMFANNPAILASWLTASHVQRPTRHRHTQKKEPATTPAP